jgi:hypothetical protein
MSGTISTMRPRVMYIELKSGHGDDGPVWIGWVKLSKTGRTVYYRGRTLERAQGIIGNHIDVDTGEEFWISGVKKNRQDRHSAGSGTVEVDPDAVHEYNRIVGA